MQRFKNDKVNALAKLAASLTLPYERKIQITIEKCHFLASALDRFVETEEINVVSVFEIEEEEDWRQSLIEYIQYGRSKEKGGCKTTSNKVYI